MPTFSITVVNRDFRSCHDVDAADLDAARSQALRGALEIGAEELCRGIPFFGAEITVEGNQGMCERLVVAIGTSPLQPPEGKAAA